MKTFFNRWIFALLVLVCLSIKFFWVEIVEHAGESFQGLASLEGGASGLAMVDMKGITGYKLAPLRNNADQIRAEHVHIVATSGISRTLAFELVSAAQDNDYPNLRLTLMRRDGSLARVLEFRPSQYGHGHALAAEEVQLTVPVEEGESKALVEPFYPPTAF